MVLAEFPRLIKGIKKDMDQANAAMDEGLAGLVAESSELKPDPSVLKLRDRLGEVLWVNPGKNNLEFTALSPTRLDFDFGKIVIDEAHGVAHSLNSSNKLGLHVVRTKLSGWSRFLKPNPEEHFLFFTQPRSPEEEKQHFLSRRPDWAHPQRWIADQALTNQGIQLPYAKEIAERGVPRLLSDRIRREAAVLGLL